MYVRIKKVKLSYLLIVIIFLLENGFGLMNTGISYLLAVVIGVVLNLCYYKQIRKNIWKFPFTRFVLGLFILFLLEILVSFVNFNQSLIISFKKVWWLLPYIYYFPLAILIQKKDGLTKLMNTLLFLGEFSCLVNFIAYFNNGVVGLFNVSIGYRNNEFFVVFAPTLLIFSTLIILHRILNSRKNSKALYFFLILNLVCFVVIMKFRAQMIGVVGACLMGFLSYSSKGFLKKIKVWIILLIALIIVGETFYESITILMNEVLSSVGTAGVRIEATQYFISETVKLPYIIFGHGGFFLDLHNKIPSDYFLSDVGIFGWFYKYGGIGIVYYIYYIYLIIQQVRVKQNLQLKNYFALSYLVFRLLTCLTLVHLDYPSIIIYDVLYIIVIQGITYNLGSSISINLANNRIFKE